MKNGGHVNRPFLWLPGFGVWCHASITLPLPQLDTWIVLYAGAGPRLARDTVAIAAERKPFLGFL